MATRWTDPPVAVTVPSLEQQAGQIVIDALTEAGMNPRNPSVPQNLMVRELVAAWGRGALTRAHFVKACKNLLILNPKLGE